MVKCAFCPETEETVPIRFEKHHLYGKKYSPEMVAVCPNCHAKITKQQNVSPPKVRASKNRKEILFQTLRTNFATIKLVGENGLKVLDELMGMKQP